MAGNVRELLCDQAGSFNRTDGLNDRGIDQPVVIVPVAERNLALGAMATNGGSYEAAFDWFIYYCCSPIRYINNSGQRYQSCSVRDSRLRWSRSRRRLVRVRHIRMHLRSRGATAAWRRQNCSRSEWPILEPRRNLDTRDPRR